MASLQVASPQAEEVSSHVEEHTVMTPPAQNFDIENDEKPVHLIEDDRIEQEDEEDDDDIEIIPRRDEGKQVKDLDDATDEEEEDIGVRPATQFDGDDDEEYEEPAGKGIGTRRFPEDEDDE